MKKNNEKKNNKKIIIISIICIIVLIIALLALLHSCKDTPASTNGGMVYDANAEDYSPSSLPEDDKDGIVIPGYSTIYFPAGEKDVQLTLYNPEKNTCLFKFEVYIEGEDKPIATTDLIEPGKAVQNITLTKALNAGEYKLNIKVLAFTPDTYSSLNNAIVRANLIVLEQ